MLSPEIKTKINQLWDKFLSGGFSDPLVAIEQITYLFFMKWLEERDIENIKNSKSSGKKYISTFQGNIEIRGQNHKSERLNIKKELFKWSYIKTMDPKRMLDHVGNNMFPFISRLNPEQYPFCKYMQGAAFLIPKPSLLDDAVKKIDEIYDEIERQRKNGELFHDTPGDVYEFLVNEISVSGKDGQFRTPRHIIRMITEIVDPGVNDKVCDPACGSAGFLVGAYQYMLAKHSSKKQISPEDENGFQNGTGDKIKSKERWQKLHTKTFYGFDADVSMVRFALMNLMLHDVTHPHIEQMDTLSKQYESYELPGQYSVVFANPPFKGIIDKGDKAVTQIESNKAELLFIERIISMLDKNGRAGVIVPGNVLTGNSNAHKEVRKLLLQTCELKAVINMPAGVFKPYTNIATAVLFFTKVTGENKTAADNRWSTKQVWFYEMTSDGYSLDDSRRQLNEKPLPGIVAAYRKHVDSKNQSADRTHAHFYVPIKEIIDADFDLGISRYKKIVYDEPTYEPPKEILSKLLKLEEEIMVDLKSLNESIK